MSISCSAEVTAVGVSKICRVVEDIEESILVCGLESGDVEVRSD